MDALAVRFEVAAEVLTRPEPAARVSQAAVEVLHTIGKSEPPAVARRRPLFVFT